MTVLVLKQKCHCIEFQPELPSQAHEDNGTELARLKCEA